MSGLGYGGVAGWMSAGWAGECWIGIRCGRPLDERRTGGRVLDWDTVALLDRRPLDERTLEILGECWIKDTVALLDRWETAG
jgi:hypothetical protein